MPKKGLVKAGVPAWCLRWQDVLGLSDWDIDVAVVPHAQLMAKHDNAFIMGNCCVNDEHKKAWISVLDPDTDVKPDGRMEFDLEHTLLHEHLHISFDPLDRIFENMVGLLGDEAKALMRKSYRSAMEQIVNQMAKAFRRVKK